MGLCGPHCRVEGRGGTVVGFARTMSNAGFGEWVDGSARQKDGRSTEG